MPRTMSSTSTVHETNAGQVPAAGEPVNATPAAQPDPVAPKSHAFPIHRVYKVFQDYFRPRRKRAFMTLFPEVTSGASVVDIGGTSGWWREDFPKGINISIVNIDDDHRDNVIESGFKFYMADGRKLPFADGEFDLSFSNSVIEHVGDLGDQRRFAMEALRCGKKLYLQTPAKWFPVEPHMMTVFIQWLPFGLARRLVRYLSLWGLVAKPSQKQIDQMLLTTRLMTKRELQQIFPGARIMEEKFLGLTKSFIVIVQ
jgi:Methyltransferase domain